MPQLIGLILVGAGLVAGYKAIRHAAGRLAAELDRAAEEARRRQEAEPIQPPPKDLGALELDPASGVYRPRRS